MRTRKAAAILSLLGLGLSLSLLHSNSQAASNSSRALSPGEMATTRGAGWLCDGVQCTGTNGCNPNLTQYTTWYPSYHCTWALYGSCTDFASAWCYFRRFYATGMCADPDFETGTPSAPTVNYCGLYP